MKPSRSTDRDPQLSRLLGAWNVHDELPPKFAEGVWRRVAHGSGREAARSSAWRELLALLESWVGRPLGAASCLALFTAVGIVAGTWHAESMTARTEAAWQQAYIQSVSPVMEVTSP